MQLADASGPLRLRRPPALLVGLWLLAAAVGSSSEHACEAEVNSACPDRPGAEVAKCLKDPSEHERPTVISTECTDFLALNIACAEVISQHCEEAFFSPDTILCLTSWVQQDALTDKCRSVMSWAIARDEEEEAEEGPTDELGMSTKDYEEKLAWQARHKAERSAAIERMGGAQREKKMKELERLKEEDPAEYKRVVEEEARQQKELEEQKKRDRKLHAALERKRREELGLPPDDVEDASGAPKRKRRRSKLSWFAYIKAWVKANWLPLVLGTLFVVYLFFNVLNIPGMLGRGKEDSDSEDDKDD